MKVKVYHSYYGCDTGCCGHIVEIRDDKSSKEHFEFEHNYSTLNGGQTDKEWARAFAERVIKERWPECLPSIDWDTMEIEVGD